MNHYTKLLNGLLLLFFLRVSGQVLVVLFNPTWLPPMNHWYSGLIPYPILFPIQIVMILSMLRINYETSRGQGYFEDYARPLGAWLQRFSYLYFGVMTLRYAVTMWAFPGRRWFGEGTIPIVFHFVLAAYVYVLGDFYLSVLTEEELQT